MHLFNFNFFEDLRIDIIFFGKSGGFNPHHYPQKQNIVSGKTAIIVSQTEIVEKMLAFRQIAN